MTTTTPTPHDLRMLLPDVALAADKAELLRQLRPLMLDINPYDEDYLVEISLTNGYRLALTAGDLSIPSQFSWVRDVPVALMGEGELATLAVCEALGRDPVRIVQVPVYCAWVRLLHEDEQREVPPTQAFVESPSCVALIEDALTWARTSSGLPLRMRHMPRSDA